MPRAAVCTALGEPLTVMDLRLDPPGPGEVRIAMRASGVCATDASIVKGQFPSPLPIVLGHQGAGVVTEVGGGVTSLRTGDHVAVAAMPQCGACFRCRRGQHVLCEVGDVVLRTGAMRDGTMRLRTEDGTRVAQMVAAGTFAEEVVVSAVSAVRLPGEIPFAVASLLGCGVVTGFGAVTNGASIRTDDTVVVIGCGSVGLAAVQGARLSGAQRIIAVDTLAAKVDLAARVGATDTVVAGPDIDVVVQVRELTRRGADVTLDCVGVQSTTVAAIRMTGKGGQVVFVGAGDAESRIDVNQWAGLAGPAKTFTGVLFGNSDIQRDITRIAEAYLAGDYHLDEMATHEFGLDEVNDGLEALNRTDVVSAVVTF